MGGQVTLQLDRNNLKQVVKSVEIADIARVEPRRVGVSSRGDQQIHRSRARLTPSIDNRCSDVAVTRGHILVEWQRVEFALNQEKSS